MTILDAVILGIVEGITEFLPVSSTGHLILTAEWLGLGRDEAVKDALDDYLVAMQGFALLAIVGLYFPRLWQMLRGILGKDAAGLRLFGKICLAFLPMLVAGPLLYSATKAHLFRPLPVLAALLLGGVWMIWLDHRRKQLGEARYTTDLDSLSWKQALGIGLFQCVSIWPGTSRAMMTIAGGIVLGMKPARAAEFSFLLGLPTILGATIYALGKDLLRGRDPEQAGMVELLGLTPMLVGFAVSAVAAALAVKWFVSFLGRHGLALFGWYRIAFALLLGVALWQGWAALE
jgi:undecaprenyl-diphosphatase